MKKAFVLSLSIFTIICFISLLHKNDENFSPLKQVEAQLNKLKESYTKIDNLPVNEDKTIAFYDALTTESEAFASKD